jgi:hypothetical protein
MMNKYSKCNFLYLSKFEKNSTEVKNGHMSKYKAFRLIPIGVETAP